MPTPVVLTGFEHGNLSASGGGLVNSITGSVMSVDSAVKRSGNYSLKCTEVGVASYVTWNLATPAVITARFYIRFASLPASGIKLFWDMRVTAGNPCRFQVASTGVCSMQWSTGTAQTGPTLAVDTWYRVDLLANQGAGTKTCDWQIDGAAQTQATLVEAASTFTSIRCGGSTAETMTFWYDDVFISVTSGDYPIGASQAVGLSSNADGTHNAGTNIMEDASGNDIGAVTAFNLLDDVPMGNGTTTDRVQQTGAGTGNYAEVQFADMPSSSAVNGVMAYLCYQSAATQANQGATIVSADDFSTFSDVFGNPTTRGDMSETSDFFKSVIVAPPGGTWSEAEVNNLKMRIGYSGDVNPVPYWLSVECEVDYVPGAAAPFMAKSKGIFLQAVNRAATY
jgi:hypothetical protein